jgi:hypothetical protein
VECEFSDAGCDAKVYRKDLPSHLGENMVAHMSLLARENRVLKLQLREQEENNRELKIQLRERHEKLTKQVQKQQDDTQSFLSRVPPVDISFNVQSLKQGEPWLPKPFYSHIGGYKLQLEVHLIGCTFFSYKYKYRYNLLDSEFTVPPSATLHITTQIKAKYANTVTRKDRVVCGNKGTFIENTTPSPNFRSITFHISQIEIET